MSEMIRLSSRSLVSLPIWERRLSHILLSLDGRWLLDWTPRAASHAILWSFLEANGLLAEADRLVPAGNTRLHDYRFHHFYSRHGYCTEADLRSDRLRVKHVRNPYDRLVTGFLNLAAQRHDYEPHARIPVAECTFHDFLEWLLDGNHLRNPHWVGQRQPFEVDLGLWHFILRAESLETDIRMLEQQHGIKLKTPPPQHRHATERRHFETTDLSHAPLGALHGVAPDDYGLLFDGTTLRLAEALVGDDADFYGYACPYG